MAAQRKPRMKADRPMTLIQEALAEYGSAHPQAKIDLYRHSSVSIRVRIIDGGFEGKSRAQREDEIWPLLERLPEEVVAELSLLLLLTPNEAKKSFANVEFDDPVPSLL